MTKASIFKTGMYLVLKIYAYSFLGYKEYNNSLKQLLIGGRGTKVDSF